MCVRQAAGVAAAGVRCRRKGQRRHLVLRLGIGVLPLGGGRRMSGGISPLGRMATGLRTRRSRRRTGAALTVRPLGLLQGSRHVAARAGRVQQIPDDRGALPQSLTGLLSRLGVPDVVPQSGVHVFLEEPARRRLVADGLDDATGDEGLFALGAIDVGDFDFVDEFAEGFVPGVVVGAASSAAH